MREFNVLPTDQRFKDLTTEQKAWIWENMELDSKQQARAMKGLDGEYFEDDSDMWNKPTKDIDLLENIGSVDKINEQIEDIFKSEELQKAKERFSSTQEYVDYLEQGGANAKEMVTDSHIRDSLEKAYKDARARESLGEPFNPKDESMEPTEIDTELTKADIDEALKLYQEGNDDDFVI